MILLSLILLAGAPQTAPPYDLGAGRSNMTRPTSDLCEGGAEGWQSSPASMLPSADDIPRAYDEGAEPGMDEPAWDDSYQPEDDPEEEQCPMIFVVPFDFWDGELWFDAAAYGPAV